MMKKITLLFFVSLSLLQLNSSGLFAACDILPVEAFSTNANFSTGTSTTTKYWSPATCTTGGLIYNSSGGCSGGYIGYSGSWNNYYGCFLRTPQANCTGNTYVTLNFDISNSYFSNHPNDKIRFYMWVDGGYKNASSVKIGGVDVGFTDINGLWLKFDQLRNCVNVDVIFDLTTCSNLSNILFYLEPNCGYNDGNVFSVVLDNISIKGAAPTANAGTDETICNGTSVQLNATGGTTYSWSPSAGLSSTIVANPLASPAVTTTYYVTVSDACGSDTDSLVVTVNALPATPVITQNGDTLFSSAPSGNQWYNDGGIITGETGDTLIPLTSGNYYVIVTDSNTCQSDTSNVINYIVTSLEGFPSTGFLISVFPNPSKDMLTIEATACMNRITITNPQAQVVLDISLRQTKTEIDISGLAKGLYFVKVNPANVGDEQSSMVRIFVKE